MSPCETRPAAGFYAVLAAFSLLTLALGLYVWSSSPVARGKWIDTRCRSCGAAMVVESGQLVYRCNNPKCGAVHPLLDLR